MKPETNGSPLITVKKKAYVMNQQRIYVKDDIYCATECGLGCSRAEYLKAVQDAQELQQRLGPEWEVRVWDNLGWKYGATNGVAALYPSSHADHKRWLCIIDVPNLGSVSAWGDSPEEAARTTAKKVTDSINKMLESFKKPLRSLLKDQSESE